MQRTKKKMKTILKQDSNSIQRQDIVTVSNLKARKIKTLLPSPIHLAHHPIAAAVVALLLLRCCTAIAPLWLRCCRSFWRYAVTPDTAAAVASMSLRFHSNVTPLSLRYCSAIAQLSLSCRSAVALLPLLALCCSWCCSWCCSCCCYAVTAAIAPAVTPLSLLMLLWCCSGVALVLLWCCSGVALVSLRYRFVISPPSLRCWSATTAVTPAVTPAIDPSFTPLLWFGFFAGVVSRGRISVTVSIGDC